MSVILLDPVVAKATSEALRLALEAANIESRPVWKPMHLQPVFRDAPMIGGAVAARLYATGLCLPSGSSLTDAEIDRVCDAVCAALL
jgi:pyridoxal phosphate-dependent aminotransferase EpsN